MANLKIKFAGIEFQNPVFVSAGTFGYGDEFAEIIDVNRLGGIVTKTLTLKPREGNPAPRVAPTASGMLNSVGLQNIGIEKFLQNKLPELNKIIKVPLIISIMGESVEEFIKLTELSTRVESINAIELNLSCPNVKAGGTSFSIEPRLTKEVVREVKKVSRIPVFVKLTPNVTDIVPIAKAAESAGADAIVAVNTFLGMSIDVETQKSKLGTKTGGLSGPAIKPMALYHVHRICQSVKIPVVGVGGIVSGSDAIEFILVGASAIAVGTGNYIDPQTSKKVLEGIEDYMQKQKINSLSDIRGKLQEI